MASFKDRNGQEWNVSLDPVIAMDVKEKHAISLTDLKQDPMLPIRMDENYPEKLIAVLHTICEDQIKERNLTPEKFAKLLPFPPDPMLTAIEEAIVSFFPTGRASHVREVLASYANMGSKTDALIIAKIQKVADDPRTTKAMNERVDQEIEKALTTMTGSPPGT
jgi:hypothetical protein